MAKITIDLNSIKDAKQIGVIVQEAVEKKRREIGLTLLQQLAIINPVNLGRLRWGWTPSLNIPSDYLPEEGKYPFPDIAGRSMSEWGNSTFDDVFYVVNNVPYAVYVNNGTVKLAPRRFVERTITVIGNLYNG